jgi:beta-glucosidase
MKRISIVLSIAWTFQSFCPPPQQSLVSAQTINLQMEDSDRFMEAATRPARPKRDYTREIDSLLSRMTLEEKVGQMTQLEIGMITSGEGNNIRVDPVKLEKAVIKYGAGSILNVKEHALTVDKWREIIRDIQEAGKKTRLKIPVIYGIDTIHGANYIQGATLFPQEIGMAATWNPVLMQRAAGFAAAETRVAGIPWTFSPVLDLGRQPLWPRFYETFGEDPYLASVMGAAFVRGVEGDDISAPTHIATSLKHYLGYSFPLTGRDRTPAWIPENYLREYFLPPFAAAIKAGAHTVMVNSAEINGTPGHINHHVLTDILRTELGFKGFIVSDWEDIKKLVSIWKVAADEKEATRLAVMAGIDMSMVPSAYTFSDLLIQLVKEGKVPQTRIDQAVKYILRVKYELGLFDDPTAAAPAANFATAAARSLSLEAARESMTLLKNDGGILPLRQDQKILVTGPTADSSMSLNNGWTYVWQGNNPALYPKDRPTVLAAIKARGGNNVSYLPGTEIDKEIDITAAVNAARAADVVVVCIGEASYAETPGNITDLTLNEPQLKLAEALEATGKPVVLVLIEGRPRVINRIADKARGILMAYNPGNEGGTAIVDVLYGDYNPSGKLPFTYPRTANGLMTYDHKLFETEDTSFGNAAFRPQFEFGQGLSYTNFTYSNLRLGQETIGANNDLSVTVTVTNSGARAGKEAVQLYLSDLVASIAPPGKRLKRFAKIELQPDQSRDLRFTLHPADLSFIGSDNRPVIEPGDFEVTVGALKSRFTVK